MPKQTDNRYLDVKVRMRVEMAGNLGEPLCVMDLYHGAGHIWEAAREVVDVQEVLATDVSPRKSGTMKMPALRAIRHFDLTRYNVFDIDSYGSAWPEYWLLCRRLAEGAGRRVAVAVTWGFFASGAGVASAVWEWLGVERRPGTGGLDAEQRRTIGRLAILRTWRPDGLLEFATDRQCYWAAVGNTGNMRGTQGEG